MDWGVINSAVVALMNGKKAHSHHSPTHGCTCNEHRGNRKHNTGMEESGAGSSFYSQTKGKREKAWLRGEHVAVGG